MEFRQWQRKAQRAVRQSVNEIREMKMRWEEASGLGFNAATEAADMLLALLRLPRLELGELNKFADLLPECERKYKLKIDHCLTKLKSACDQLQAIMSKLRLSLDVLNSVGNGEDWIVFSSLNWTTMRSIIDSIHAMYAKELETKIKVKGQFLQTMLATDEKIEMELSDNFEVLLRVWLLETHIDEDSCNENLRMLIEECRT